MIQSGDPGWSDPDALTQMIRLRFIRLGWCIWKFLTQIHMEIASVAVLKIEIRSEFFLSKRTPESSKV